MKITSLTFEKRWNLGDYNHENLIASAGVEEGENPSTALKDLIAFVRTKGAEEVTSAASAPPTQAAASEKKEVKKEKKTAETKVKVEEKQVEETGKEESNGKEESKNETQSETKGEEKKPETKKVVSKNKGVPYDPDNNQHKKLVGEFLDKASPSWRANTSPAKAVSQVLRGAEFQDSEGLIMEEFKTKFLEELKTQKA